LDFHRRRGFDTRKRAFLSKTQKNKNISHRGAENAEKKPDFKKNFFATFAFLMREKISHAETQGTQRKT